MKFQWKQKNNFSGDHAPDPWHGLTCNFQWRLKFAKRSGDLFLSWDNDMDFFPTPWLEITALSWDENQVSWPDSSQIYMKNYMEKHAGSSDKSHIHLLKQNCWDALHWVANAWARPAKRIAAELSWGWLSKHRIKRHRNDLCIKSWKWGEFLV